MERQLTIAVASGKGGTGKTTIATNLAVTLAGYGHPVAYVDCDVEEPDGNIFLKVKIDHSEQVTVRVPEILSGSCNSCGECSKICQFNAIVFLGDKPLAFPELCHSCGGCSMVCPEGAIIETSKEIGVREEGSLDGLFFVQGRLNIGVALVPPLIRAVKKRVPAGEIVIIDSPPGASCSAVAAMKKSGFVVLVAEPTPFGLHDLKIAAEMVRELGIPSGVVINRAGLGDNRVAEFCKEMSIPVLAMIPDDRKIAETYSRGSLIVDVMPEYRHIFAGIYEKTLEKVSA